MSTTIKAIVFDADGVVIKTDELYSKKYARVNGLDEELVQQFFDLEFESCLVGELDLKEAIKPYLTKWQPEESVESFIKTWFSTESTLNKEVIGAIKQLRRHQIPCFLMSNQEKYRAHYLIDTIGFNQLFDHCFFSYEMHSRKPEEKAFRYVIDSLSYLEGIDDPAQIMYWDDIQENVAAASQLGVNAHVYDSYSAFSQALGELLAQK